MLSRSALLNRATDISALVLSFVLPLAVCLSPASAAERGRPVQKKPFLIVSDFHFDPMADPTLVPKLQPADPTQWDSIFNTSKSTAFSQYGQDTNWWLLQSSLDQMRKTLPHPAFIVFTGDSLAHQFPDNYQRITHDSDRERYRQFVLKTMQFLALQARRRFPGTPILVTPGNNDEECGNYSIEAGGVFLHDTAGLISDLAHGDDQVRTSWENLGSYDVPHPKLRGVRIISLNTVFFSNDYQAQNFSGGCATVPSDGPANAFSWLQARLKHAQEAHEKVWLMFHIPPGIDGYFSVHRYQSLLKKQPQANADEQLCASAIVPMWVPSWTAKFEALLNEYHQTVIAIFAGHTHNDNFQVINASGPNPVYVLISPAISPVYNENPAFRTVTYADDGSILDSSVYYLTNLIYASSTTPGQWEREYTFSQQWKLPRIDAATLSQLYGRIRNNPDARADWMRLWNTSSSAGYIPAGGPSGLSCTIEALDIASYRSCYCSPPSESSTPAANLKP